MEKIVTEKFNQSELTVWFVIDNIRYHDENQEIIEKDDEFICFFNFKEPTILILGELIKNSNGQIAVFKSANNALNYVKKIDLQD